MKGRVLSDLHSRISHGSIKRAKLFQLFFEKCVLTIIAKMNNAIIHYNRARIAMILGIFGYQSFKLCNF